MKTPKSLLAYWDTFSGLIPCVVLSIEGNIATIRLTADRGSYHRGEIHTSPCVRVWPRDVTSNKRGTYGMTKIVLPYNWAERLANV